MSFFKQLLHFGYQQAMSSIFPVLLFITLGVSKYIEIPFLHRYDFILMVSILVQIWMYRSGLESKDEVKVTFVFHVIGLSLEMYKVHMGSWSYPEEAVAKLFGVPLYSGFMYASVASYMTQAWRRLGLQLQGWPTFWITVPLGAAIYLNFYTHHFLPDFRWWLTAIIFLVFIRTFVDFTVNGKQYRMPLTLSFLLIGFFIWLAENIATYLGAWQYPNQRLEWNWVHFGKISSWFLLVIISFMIVAELKHVKEALAKNSHTLESDFRADSGTAPTDQGGILPHSLSINGLPLMRIWLHRIRRRQNRLLLFVVRPRLIRLYEIKKRE